MINPGLFSSYTGEWDTPKTIVDKVVEVLGQIDLDPCSEPDMLIPSTVHYTIEENGLVQDWRGKVYINPPYGREIIEWVYKLCRELKKKHVEEAIFLCPARVDTKWWNILTKDSSSVAFIKGRLKFSDSFNSAPFPSALVYFGPSPDRFISTFKPISTIWSRMDE